jgi:hypothetical protein
MIKKIKSSDKNVKPFTAFKKWKYSTIDSLDSILLEQITFKITNLRGELIKKFATLDELYELIGEPAIKLTNRSKKVMNTSAYKIEKNDAESVLYESGIEVSPEKINSDNRDSFEIKKTYGKNIKGTFYPIKHKKFDKDKELLNYDGTYQRLIYKNIKHLFYNDYFVEHYDYNQNRSLNIKNPLMLFGVESAEYNDPTVIEDIDQGEEYTSRRIERRVVGDEITILQLSQKNFGDKIKPNSFSITDYSSRYDKIVVRDDGYTNLITDEFTFSEIFKVQTEGSCDTSLQQKTLPDSFSFGKTLKSFGDYMLVGSPEPVDSLHESQSGYVELYKKDEQTNSFKCLKKFICPFTQNGLALEQRQDHNDLVLKELSNILLSNDYALNDNFGCSLEISENFCVIGASKTHIRGKSEEERTGNIFIYEKNKGGVDHWGVINIFEGIPDTDFGHSVSMHDDVLAVGAPGAMEDSGVVYIFRKSTRQTNTPWMRLSDVPDGYMYELRENKRKGYPTGDTLRKINEYTTRWKIESMIPPGSQLGTFYKGNYETVRDNCISGSYLSGSYFYDEISGSVELIRLPDTIISGSITSGCLVSGNLISGCYESGSILSGCFVSGNFMSGCYESGSNISGSLNIISGCVVEQITPPEQIISGSIDKVFFENCMSGSNIYIDELECDYELTSFSGEKLFVDTIINDVKSDFDSGYEPHKYSNSPDFSIGDTTWELVECIFGEETSSCERFGENIKVYQDKLYVSTPSSKNKNVYIFEYNKGSCPNEYGLTDVITKTPELTENPKSWILNTQDKILNDTQSINLNSREDSVLYPFEYTLPKNNFNEIKSNFGISLDVNESFLVIGDSLDRIYTSDLETNEAGVCHVFNNSDKLKFMYSTYSQKNSEEETTFRFANSVSLFENTLVVGSYSTEFSNLYFNDNGELEVDDYFFGTDNSEQSYLDFGDSKKNTVQGKCHIFKLETDHYEDIKTINSTKEKMSCRRQYGYAVTISSSFIYVGAPVIGNFPFYEITTFDKISITANHSEHLFLEYETHLNKLHNSDDLVKEYNGFVNIYDTSTIHENKKKQIGNIFYKNGIVVLSDINNTYMQNFLQRSGLRGHEINFKGTHTLFETEILCKVEPMEFNISTNPTSLVHDQIKYDVNQDGKFDIRDLILIFKFLTKSTDVGFNQEDINKEVREGIAVEQDTNWPNADILLTESEDAILDFFTVKSNEIDFDEFKSALPYLRKLKKEGDLDINEDGIADSKDAKLLIRYFRGNSGLELIRGLISSKSKRRVSSDIIQFLDNNTGKYNGIKKLEYFDKFTDLQKLIDNGKNLDSLKPHVTTIGLYDGLSLVGVAKLGKPLKISESYPINFLVKYDG